MEDYFNLPNIDSNVSIFYFAGNSTWQVWNKPKNSRFVMITCIGGGAGGGGGQSGAGTNRTGGGGGGPSTNNKGIFPSMFIPDTLFVNVGGGGSGGTANNSGGTGSISYVSTTPTSSNDTVLIQSTQTSPSGGQSNGTAGSGAGTNLTLNPYLQGVGIFQLTGLVRNGAAGGTSSGGTGSSPTMDYALCGGAGGGGASSTGVCGAGGNVPASRTGPQVSTQYPGLSGGTASGTTNGADGTKIMMPSSGGYITAIPYLYGGAGGGGNGTAAGTNVGGKGGDGYYGCGGGGGGAGDTGGAGGNGGDGFVMIISY